MKKDLTGHFPDAHIFVVDDNPDNAEVAHGLLTFAGYTNILTLLDPREALQRIHRDRPDLVLLDLHMPGLTGYEILTSLDELNELGHFIPILVCTADNTQTARKKALDLGAHDFITKPFDALELILRVRNFLSMRQMYRALNHDNVALEARVRDRMRELEFARLETLECLARAGEYRDDATGEHPKRVGVYSGRLAEAIGLDPRLVEQIRLAAPLHDLGKIGVPDDILRKPSALTVDEREVIMRHCTIGDTIVGECQSPLLRMVRLIARHHHEHWDGSGYPDRLEGEEIPLVCRIVTVADVFDALCSERPYKGAWSVRDAMAEIRRQRGKQLDPQLVDAFLELFQERAF